jgi:hypothetical protein
MPLEAGLLLLHKPGFLKKPGFSSFSSNSRTLS